LDAVRKKDFSGATCQLAGTGDQTETLKASTYGFLIPTGATIDGVEVRVRWQQQSATQPFDKVVRLEKSGGSGDNKATETNLPTSTWETRTYGGAADLWGLTLTPAEVNDSAFGVSVQLEAQNGGGGPLINLDSVEIRVHYTYGTFGGTIDASTSVNSHDAREDEDGTDFSYTAVTTQLRSGAGASNSRRAGFYFAAAIPEGRQIDSALFKPTIGSGTGFDATIHCQAADYVDTFAVDQDVVSRPLTSLGVAWAPSGISPVEQITSPQFPEVVQEVVDRIGWTGAVLAVILKPTTGGSDQTVEIQDHTGTAPNLVINYSEGCRAVYAATLPADSAWETEAGVVDTGAPLQLQTGGWLGLRFQHVRQPAGKTLQSARLYLLLAADSETEIDATVRAEAADDMQNFAAWDDIDGRTYVGSTVAWSASGLSQSTWITSPELKTMVDSQISSYHADGEPMVLAIEDQHVSYWLDPLKVDQAKLVLIWEATVDVAAVGPLAASASLAPLTVDAQQGVDAGPMSAGGGLPPTTVAVQTELEPDPLGAVLTLEHLEPSHGQHVLTIGPLAAGEAVQDLSESHGANVEPMGPVAAAAAVEPNPWAASALLAQSPLGSAAVIQHLEPSHGSDLPGTPIAAAGGVPLALPEPGIDVQHTPVAGAAAPTPYSVSVDTHLDQSPAAAVVTLHHLEPSHGTDMPGTPIAAAAGVVPVDASPGIDEFGNPLSAAAAVPPATEAIDTTLAATPLGAAAAPPPTLTSLGWDVAHPPQAAGGVMAPRDVTVGSTLLPSPLASGLAVTPRAVIVGQILIADPIPGAAAAAPYTVAVEAELRADPLRAAATLEHLEPSHGTDWSTVPMAAVFVSPPAAMGAVHVTAPDLWTVLKPAIIWTQFGDALAWYVLPAD